MGLGIGQEEHDTNRKEGREYANIAEEADEKRQGGLPLSAAAKDEQRGTRNPSTTGGVPLRLFARS